MDVGPRVPCTPAQFGACVCSLDAFESSGTMDNWRCKESLIETAVLFSRRYCFVRIRASVSRAKFAKCTHGGMVGFGVVYGDKS